MQGGDKVQVVKFVGWHDYDFEKYQLDKSKPILGIIEKQFVARAYEYDRLCQIKLFKQGTEEFSGHTLKLLESELEISNGGDTV